MGERVSFCKADVRDEAQIDALVEHCVAEHGRLDVWVNNAGVGVHTLAVDTTLEDFELQVDVQLIGAFLGGAGGSAANDSPGRRRARHQHRLLGGAQRAQRRRFPLQRQGRRRHVVSGAGARMG